jgi:hypothetical protein
MQSILHNKIEILIIIKKFLEIDKKWRQIIKS